MAKKTQPKTNAMRMLDAASVSYHMETYDCGDGHFDGEHAARQLGKDPREVFKTLVLRDDSGRLLVCCIPVHRRLHRKALAQAAGAKSVDMVQPKELQGLTGYIRGGCSPIGMKKPLPTFIDRSALALREVTVSAGQRGMQMCLQPMDLIDQTTAAVGDFIQEEGEETAV